MNGITGIVADACNHEDAIDKSEDLQTIHVVAGGIATIASQLYISEMENSR